jgi:hypothetical protein
MSPLQSVKFWLVENVHLAKDALHIYVGLIVFLGSAALFRWPLRSWKPWAAVLVVTLAGEAWDMIDRLRGGITQSPDGNWKDVWNTMFWPTILFMLARYTTILRRAGRG